MTHIVDVPPPQPALDRERDGGLHRRRAAQRPPHDPGARGVLREVLGRRVLPRLAALHTTDEADVAEVAALALGGDGAALTRRLDEMIGAGRRADTVPEQLLAPAARLLGEEWVADRLAFLDVTLAVGALETAMRRLAPRIEGDARLAGPDRAILLAAAPGEQHTFGLSILASAFRRAGWHVVLEPAPQPGALEALVSRQRFAAVGLTCAGDGFVSRLSSVVQAVRRASCSRGLAVIAGGGALAEWRDAILGAGVDGVAADASGAVALASSLVSMI